MVGMRMIVIPLLYHGGTVVYCGRPRHLKEEGAGDVCRVDMHVHTCAYVHYNRTIISSVFIVICIHIYTCASSTSSDA